MHFPKYWAQGVQTFPGQGRQVHQFAVWEWSDLSEADARQKAETRAADIGRRFLAQQTLGRYGYSDRPLREEVKESIKTPAGREVAVVTRNAYGVLVLNALQAMFIDIDFPDTAARRVAGYEAEARQRVAAWAAQRPDLGLRLYRTCAGLRGLIVNVPFAPTGAEAQGILRDLKSDPLYAKLCQAQDCFRARLTPKPWRCDVLPPPARFPWPNPRAETAYRQWEQAYDRTAMDYATCRLVQELGPRQVHPDIAPVLTLHDYLACAKADRELA